MWPVRGLSNDKIWEKLNEALEKNISYDKDIVMGFPGTKPLPIGVEAYSLFMAEHPNNICTHTSDKSEKGFSGTQALERYVIGMTAELMGANPSDVHGYISSGGTEGNIMGVLTAREYFRQKNDYPVVVLGSFFTHYSFRKAVWLLDISSENWGKCNHCSDVFRRPVHHIYNSNSRNGRFDLLGTDKTGRISLLQLEDAIRSYYCNGERNFLIVLNQGNVITGAIDNTYAVNELLNALKGELSDANFYVHVDAAFGGFVVPFLYDKRPICFQMDNVASVTMDPHKMGLAPYPAGIFLYRKDFNSINLRDLLGVQMGYVPGGTDGTLIGSRPGASAAACYAIFNSLGFEGYRENVKQCMQNANMLSDLLKKNNKIKVIDNDLNVVSFSIGQPGFELSSEFIESMMLVHHLYPIDFSNPRDHVQQIYKVTCMPHVTQDLITTFIKLLEEQLK